MINKNILHSELVKKFGDLTFHAIVNEAFINALPINKEHITLDERRALTKYSYNVVKSIGGLSCLESAINEDKTFEQNMFLADIYTICMESAKACARQREDAVDKDDEDITMKDLVDRSALSEAEFKEFASKVEGVNLDKVSEIIKNKTIAVIKDEQEQYEKEAELDEALQDALSESKDDKTVESYMDMFLDKTAPRHHITVFSKLQETAMEMLNVTKIAGGEDYFPIIEKVTEAFIPMEKAVDFDSVTESLQKISNEDYCYAPTDKRAKMATLVSVIVYTVMETLKTMGIFCPCQNDIKKFVTSKVDGATVANENRNDILNKAETIIRESKLVDYSKLSSQDLSKRLVQMKSITEMAQEALCREIDNTKLVSIITSADKNIEAIESVINQRMLSEEAKANVTESFNDMRIASNDVAQFNKISNLYGKNPMVNEIILNVNPDMLSVIDVQCANESHSVVKTSFMNIECACESFVYLDYLKDTFAKSKLYDCPKSVSIVVKDGTGRKINLK